MPLIFFFHERFEPVLVLQIRGLVVQGPLELGFTLFVGGGAVQGLVSASRVLVCNVRCKMTPLIRSASFARRFVLTFHAGTR